VTGVQTCALPISWLRLAPSLLLIAAGIACVNQVELAQLAGADAASLRRYAEGAALAVAAVACWTWYPIRNADWLRAHAERSPRAWATAQGLVTLPMALIALLAVLALQASGVPLLAADFALPLGPRPAAYLGLMAAVGLFASWLGTLCWNEASQRLPTTLVGQLIVFETLSALAYAFVLRREWPGAGTLAGIALLVAGVLWALRSRPGPEAAEAHPN
jgi:drug/metabolite transporter (DMT)-like permease